ncbi:hypothetical protein [Streptomyces albospinus]|uniref:hypothetical protein n=1 Tax=Streptomyces albospinus TaxID=285515 RepID=UPI0016712AD0|nr:hypothetical protein [Streptomyces albospinus]
MSVASMLLATICLGGCSTLSGDTPEPTVNVNEAVKQVDSILDGTVNAVRPQLKWRDGPARISERRNSFTNKANGEADVSRYRYVRTKVSKAKLNGLLAAITKYWNKEGFKASTSNPREPSLSGKAEDGRFAKFSMSSFGDVEFYVSVGALSSERSGDIKGEEGDQFPEAPNGGPDYTPDVQDSYWSK